MARTSLLYLTSATFVVAGAMLAIVLAKRVRPTASSPVDSKALQRFVQIEAERNQLDETVWAKELLSQKYEDVFVKLWDDLRSQEDAFAVLKQLAFDELWVGKAESTKQHELGVEETIIGAPTNQLSRAQWGEWLTQRKADGYHLEQSEWRLVAFDNANGSPRSSIELTLHVLQAQPQRRFIFRAALDVRWHEADLSADPALRSIFVSKLQILHRDGPPVFEHVLSREIPPDKNPIFIDPMLVYDLNSDGRAEILFAAKNRVYWNNGPGEFNAAAISTFLTESINTALIADFNGDTHPDFLAADSAGLLLLSGNEKGRFEQAPQRIRIRDEPLLNPFVMTAGDIDHDGDLDLWLAQYKLPYVAGQMPAPYYDANDGFASFLLVNDGKGYFHDQTEKAGLGAKRFRRTYSCSFVDVDSDKDLDLIVVSDFAGIDLYYNNGRGIFNDVTSQKVDEPSAFGMAHSVADYNSDGEPDIFVIGMNSFVADRLDQMKLGPPEPARALEMRAKMAYGNRLYFGAKGRFDQSPVSRDVAKSGWSWGVTSFDFDNDGDLDIYVANGHKSRVSTKDYESQFWRHDIYAANSAHDAGMDLYFGAVARRLYGAGQSYGGYYKNVFYLSLAGQSFLQVAYLLGVALETDSRNVVSEDFDSDGRLDLLVTTFEEWPRPRQGVHVFRNALGQVGHWIGLRVRESGRGFSPVGAKVVLKTPARQQIRYLVTGDSYRSQHSTTAHFGLGTELTVEKFEVHWPNGEVQTLLRPDVNRFHTVRHE